MGEGFTPFAKKNEIKVLEATTVGSSVQHQIKILVHYEDSPQGHAPVDNYYLQPSDFIVVS